MNGFFRWRDVSATYFDGFSWYCLEEKSGTNNFLYKVLSFHSNSTELNVVHFFLKLVLICLIYSIWLIYRMTLVTFFIGNLYFCCFCNLRSSIIVILLKADEMNTKKVLQVTQFWKQFLFKTNLLRTFYHFYKWKNYNM